MRNCTVWLYILYPSMAYMAAIFLLKSMIGVLVEPAAAGWLSHIIILPAVLFVCRKLKINWVKLCAGETFLWAAITGAIVLANAAVWPEPSPGSERLFPLAIAGSVLCAPVCEELIYRGLILERAHESFGSTQAILLSAVLFGAAHTDLRAALFAAAIGLILGWMRVRFHSMGAPIAAHVILNLTALIL